MSPQPKIGDVIAGHKIIRLIGEGGMGSVYLAMHEVLERRTALKILPDELAHDRSFRQRFLSESRLAAQLSKHPNILPIYDANIWHQGQPDELLYIAMYYVDGTDLGSLIDSEGPFSTGRTIYLLEQVASALDAAHARGLVHRDVKPANILIERDPSSPGTDHCYLADFGLVKEMNAASGLTQKGFFVGTPDYAAPEQLDPKMLEGQGPIDGRADVYSLGCVFYQCLTKHSPFEDKPTIRDLVLAHLLQAPPSLARYREGLPAGFDEVIAKAMAKKREDRYARCGELIGAARSKVSSRSRAATPPSTSTPAPVTPAGGTKREDRETLSGPSEVMTEPKESPPGRKFPVGWVAVAAALVVLLVAGLLVLSKGGKKAASTSETTASGPTSASGSPPASGSGTQGTTAPGTASLAATTFLEGLTPQGSDQPMLGLAIVEGHSFPDSLQYDVSGEATSDFTLGGGYVQFQATIGLKDESQESVRFVVKVDGVIALDQPLAPGTKLLTPPIDVSGAQTLTLDMTRVESPRCCTATAVWGDARLVGADTPTIPPPPAEGELLPTAYLDRLLTTADQDEPGKGLAKVKNSSFAESLFYFVNDHSSTSYNLNRKYTDFKATIGVTADSQEAVRFVLKVDGIIKKDQRVVPGDTSPVDVDLTGAGALTLEMSRPENECCSATAIWGNARVIGTGGDTPAEGIIAVPPTTPSLLRELPPASGQTPVTGDATVGGVTYADSLTYDVGGGASTDYYLDGKYWEFDATAGVRDDSDESVQFEVLVDGVRVQLFTLSAGESKEVSVILDEVGKLTLMTSRAPDSCCNATAVWGQATVLLIQA